LADCISPEAEVHEAALDADGEEGVLGDLAECSSPEAEVHEAALDADGEEGVLGDLADCSSPEADALGDELDADGEEGALADADDRSAPEAEAAGAGESQAGPITITAHHAQRRQADAAEPASAPQGSATGEAKAWATAAGRSSSMAIRFNFIRLVRNAARAAPQ
jgi:hypothetical protein